MKKNNKRNRKIESIEKLTSNFFNQNKIDLKLFDKKIENLWNAFSNKFIQERTTGVYCKNMIIYIKINSSPLKSELENSKEITLKKFQQYHKEIQNVVFI